MRHLTPVHVSDHALERYCERVAPLGRNSLAREVRRHLLPYLRVGAAVNKGAVLVEIHPGIVAVTLPSLQGGWEVATVMALDREAG